MVAKFEKFHDIETIRKAGIALNMKRAGEYVNEQFPPEIEERRRKLFPILKRFKADPNEKTKCTLVRDKLFVGNRQYNVETDTLEFNGRRSYPRPEVQPAVNQDRQHQYKWQQPRQTQRHNVNTFIDFSSQNRYQALSDPIADTPTRRKPAYIRSPTNTHRRTSVETTL